MVNNYAVIELGINSSKLSYFDDKEKPKHIYTFPAKKDMTDDEYVEYIATINDLTQHYDYVLVCTK